MLCPHSTIATPAAQTHCSASCSQPHRSTIALSETAALIGIGDHPPRSCFVLSILRVACRHQRFLAIDSYHCAGQNQPAKQSAAPRPVRRHARPSEQTNRCVDWMPDVPIWPARHQTTWCRVGRHMETAPTKRDPRPEKQQRGCHLQTDDERGRREKIPRHKQAEQAAHHPDVTNERKGLQHNARQGDSSSPTVAGANGVFLLCFGGHILERTVECSTHHILLHGCEMDVRRAST